MGFRRTHETEPIKDLRKNRSLKHQEHFWVIFRECPKKDEEKAIFYKGGELDFSTKMRKIRFLDKNEENSIPPKIRKSRLK